VAKITHSTFAEKDVLGGLKKEFEGIIKLTIDATETLQKYHKELTNQKTIEGAKDLEKLSEITQQVTKLEKELIVLAKQKDALSAKSIKALKEKQKEAEKSNKTQKQRLKLEEDLKQANSDSIQTNEELKVQLQEQRKVNKNLAKDKLGLITAYEKEAKRLNDLRKRYKKLRVEEGKETKETKKLRKEIIKLDAELKDINKEAGQFGSTLSENVESLKSTTKGMVATAAAAVGLKLSFDGLQEGAQGSAAGSENLRKVTGALSGGLKQGANVVASTIVDLFNFTKAVTAGEKELLDITDAFDETAKATDNFSEKVEESALQGIAIAESLIEFEKSSRPLEQRIASLNKLIEEQSLIAGDNTRSFDEIAEAAIKAQEAQEKRSNILIKLAKEELRITNLQVAQADAAGGASVDLLDKQTASIIKLQEARNEQFAEELETGKLLRENSRDRFERELDFAIDAFDASKTVLERQIALENQSFEQRVDNLSRLSTLSESSFQSQIKLLEDFTGESLRLNELVLIDDERVIRKRLEQFTLDDVTLGRVLEVIRERKLLTQDIADAERDVTEALKDSIKETESLVNELDQVLKQGQIDATENFEDQLALRRIALEDQADFEIMQAEENADKIEVIRAQLNNDLAALDREFLKEQEQRRQEADDKEEERKERRKELANQAVDETISRIDEQNDAKTQLIDDDISRLQDSIAIQQRIANEGGENILAEEKARLAKRNLERKRELKRQAQQEQAIALALAFVNSFAAYSKDEPKGALRKALVDNFLAKGVASLITGSFYDGVEDTGTVSNPLDSKGGRLTMTHDHERILSSAQNSMIPKGMTNDELAKMAHDYHNGNTWGFMPQISGAGDNTPLVKAIENNAKSIERSLKKYQSHQESELDTMGNFVIYTMRKGIKTIRNVTSPKL